ncbi:solute carrier family 23 protein [Escherichia coli]
MTRRAIGVSERPPLLQTIPLSLQHLFAMFGATVLVPVLFHINPATVLLFNGIGTLLYLFICKGKIPAYLGSSFAFISPVLLLLPLGYEVALGGFIMCGVLFCLVSFIVKKAGTGWLDVLFPPAAMGAIVAVIGLELAGVAAGMAGLLPAEGQTPDSKTIIISLVDPGRHRVWLGAVPRLPGDYPDSYRRAGGLRALLRDGRCRHFADRECALVRAANLE